MVVKIKRFLMKDENVKRDYIIKRKTDPKMLKFWYKSSYLLYLFLKNLVKRDNKSIIKVDNVYYDGDNFNIILNEKITGDFYLVLKSKKIECTVVEQGKLKSRVVIPMKKLSVKKLDLSNELLAYVDGKKYTFVCENDKYIHKVSDVFKQDDFRYAFTIDKNKKINLIISKTKFIYNTLLTNNDFVHELDSISSVEKFNDKWTIIKTKIDLKDLVTGKVTDIYASIQNKKGHDYVLAHLKNGELEFKIPSDKITVNSKLYLHVLKNNTVYRIRMSNVLFDNDIYLTNGNSINNYLEVDKIKVLNNKLEISLSEDIQSKKVTLLLKKPNNQTLELKPIKIDDNKLIFNIKCITDVESDFVKSMGHYKMFVRVDRRACAENYNLYMSYKSNKPNMLYSEMLENGNYICFSKNEDNTLMFSMLTEINYYKLLYKNQIDIMSRVKKIKLVGKNIRLILNINIKNNGFNCNENKIFLRLDDEEFKLKKTFKNTYQVDLSIENLEKLQLTNPLDIVLYNLKKQKLVHRINFNYVQTTNAERCSNVIKLKKQGVSIFVKGSQYNFAYLISREIIKSDYFVYRFKIFAAYVASLINRNHNKIMLYEKFANKYEESASVLYENLVDGNYKNIYYVISKEWYDKLNIDKKYRKNMILKNSFKHYYTFLCASTFISTESIIHSVDNRVAHNIIYNKMADKNKLNYVFLQHGPTYMVSLASKSRAAFKAGNTFPINAKIVVSSIKERDHFVEAGNYKRENLYVTGIPKYDRNMRFESADKIMIMPTWRQWEYNELRFDYKNSGYYQMVLSMFNSVPKKYRDKIVIAPHPLMYEAFKNTNLSEYMTDNLEYNELLKHVEVLITDYSSIAYDAFSRGANVIFWWKDLKECMMHYGGSLLLNNDNAFGQVCNSESELRRAINNCYGKKQSKEFVEKYNDIVNFSDGKNSERLIKLLEEDKLIEKDLVNDKIIVSDEGSEIHKSFRLTKVTNK